MFARIDQINFFLFIILPLLIISGPFLTDFAISISCILFLLRLNKKLINTYFLNKFSIFFFIWYFYLLLTSLLSSKVLLSLESTLFYFRFWIFSLLVFYLLASIKNTLKYFLLFIGLSFLILLIDSYFQLLVGFNLIGYEYSFKYNQSRLSGLFGEEQKLGSYLSRLSPLLFVFFIYFKNNKIINFYTVSIIFFLIFIVILFSGERTAIILFLIFSLFSIFDLKIFSKNKKFNLAFISILILGVVILISSSKTLYNRIFDYTLFQLQNDNKLNIFSAQHQVVYTTSFKIFLDHKILGIGPKVFREECKNYKTFSSQDNSIDGCQTHPHNTYVQILTETGIIGFIFIITIYIYFCINLFKKIFILDNLETQNHMIELIYKYLIIMIFINLFPFLPSGNFFNNWISAIYYLPIGFFLCYNLYKNRLEKND